MACSMWFLLVMLEKTEEAVTNVVRFSPATATTNVLQTNAGHDQESQTEAKKTSILALGRNDDIYAVAGRVSAAPGESL